MQQVVFVLALIILYGAVHSLLAAVGVKIVFLYLLGERAFHGLYRLFFNIIASITVLPIVWIIFAQPGDTIWSIGAPWSYGLMALNALGLLGLTISLLQIDTMRFLGLTQAAAWLEGDQLPLPPEPLQRNGVYRLVRHPLYLFSLLLIWPVTTMTGAWLGFCLGATFYFVVGSILEEQKMRRAFGDVYEAYRAEVPWMIPFIKA